jgi:inhibitor of KinA sporulation pathway (predicted exonuclease)
MDAANETCRPAKIRILAMSIRRNKVLVVDIESTCWEGGVPSRQVSEIIEIGICVFDVKSAQTENRESILVKPEKSTVSEFCTQLTTLTQAQVDEGVSFYEACLRLQNEFESLTRLWLSWGDYDRNMFVGQCKVRNVRYPFSEKHCNLKALFAKLRNSPKIGMAGALKKLGLPLEGTHHRGGDDAWNIGRILAELMKQHGRDILLDYWM